MRAKELQEITNKIRGKRQLSVYSSKIESHPFEEKISLQTENLSAIHALFQKKGAHSLLIAPTNAGKTYAIAEVFQKGFQNKEPHQMFLNLLVVPTIALATQVEAMYHIPKIVGKTNLSDRTDFFRENNYCLIPDKASYMEEKLTLILKQYPQAHINLCIDEAHDQCLDALGYREEAVRQLHHLEEMVLEHRGAVVKMTATPDSLIGTPFQQYLEFTKSTEKKLASKIEVFTWDPEGSFYGQSLAQIKAYVREGYFPFIRLNDKKETESMMRALKREGIGSAFVNSEEKQQHNYYDVETGREVAQYDNHMYGELVSNANLPSQKEGMPIQVYFTTSLIDLGTNIVSVDGEQPKTILPIYLCNDVKNANYTNMVQFFNRVRFQVKKYVLMMPKRTKDDIPYAKKRNIQGPKFQSLLQVALKNIGQLEKSEARLFGTLQEWESELLLNNTVDQFLNLFFGCLPQKEQGENFFVFNREKHKLEVDNARFYKHIYDCYQYQFYYHQDQLFEMLRTLTGLVLVFPLQNQTPPTPPTTKKEDFLAAKEEALALKDKVGVDLIAHVIENQIGRVKETVYANAEGMEEVQGGKEAYNQTEEEFLQMVASHEAEMMPQNSVGAEKEAEVRSFLRTKEGAFISRMVATGATAEEAFSALEQATSEASFKGALQQEIRTQKKSGLSMKEERGLAKILMGEVSYQQLLSQFEDKKVALLLELANASYSRFLKQGLTLGMSIHALLQALRSEGGVSQLKREIKSYQCKCINYLYEAKSPILMGTSALEQITLLKLFYRRNEAGNVVQTSLNHNALLEGAKALSKACGGFYTKKDVLSLCGSIFQLRKNQGTPSILQLA